MITNKQQQKIDKLLLIYGDKINSYIGQNNYKFSQEYFIQCINQSDPDSQGKSVKWVLNNVLNGNILWEDVESGDESKVCDTLNRFYLTRKQFKDQSLRDINQFKRLGDIAQQMRNINIIQSNKEIKKEQKEKIYKDTIFLYNQNGYLVVVPKTQESSCFWGLNTEWCTAATHSENYFNHYNEKGPLYICIAPDGKKYQFHKNSQPMDENDNPINDITEPVLRELALITGKIKNIKEINYQSERECLEAVKQYGYSIRYIPINISNYAECCLEAVRQNGNSIEYIPCDISNYEQCCLEAVKQDGYSIQDISRDINNYEECCLEACKERGYAIEHIPRDISNYEECCLEAVKQGGYSIRFISRDISNYNQCCLEAVKQNGYIIQDIPRDISNYEKCCLEACKKDGYVITHIPRDIDNYEECCLKAVMQYGWAIKHIPRNISNYERCCLEAVKQNGLVIQNISRNISNYEQCCLEAVKQDGYSIQDISRDINNYEQCCLEAVKQDGFAIEHITRDISNYAECCLEAVKQNGYVIQDIPHNISNYAECLKISEKFKEEISQEIKKEEKVIIPDWMENDVLKNKDCFNELVIPQVENKYHPLFLLKN